MRPLVSSSSLPKPLHQILTLTLAGIALIHPAAAQDSTSFEEKYKLIRAQNAALPLSNNLFGDSVNLYNGRLGFVQTDVSLPGNNALPVAVGRRIMTGERLLGGHAFGQWQLDIPHMHGVFAQVDGWAAGDRSGARCSQFGPPPLARGTGGISYWDASEFWHGSFLYVPGEGEQQLLRRSMQNTVAPGRSSDYPVVTANWWSISCLPSLKNEARNGPSEGFLAISTDGTQYYFDWIATFNAPTLRKSTADPATTTAERSTSVREQGSSLTTLPGSEPKLPSSYLLARKEIWFLPTKIVDRNGNTVTYTYDPAKPSHLTRIQSTDGRVITLTWGPDSRAVNEVVQSVSDGSRTWRYHYHTNSLGTVSNLDSVTLPDGSLWNFAQFDELLTPIKFFNTGGCEALPWISELPVTGSIVHPSGANGTFTLTPVIHGRSHVLRECDQSTGTPVVPLYFTTRSLTSKTIHGPGLDGMTWTFDYGPRNESWHTCTACIATKTVSVTDPASHVTRYTFGNHHNVNEGRLELKETGWNGNTALRTESFRYRPFGAGPYPTYLGSADQGNIGDSDMDSRLAPVDQRVTTQQGVTFVWEAASFDEFARPVNVIRSSSRGASRNETTTYADNVPKWVLGQVGKVQEGSTGKVMVENTFDEAANLLIVRHFGQIEKAMTYFTDGTLATLSDGKAQTTSFSNYKRGVAQVTRYADGTSERVEVNNTGMITSRTDAAGFTTYFDYDAIGRLKLISYPVGDTVTWNPTIISYAQYNVAQFGLPAGHWRQVIKTGNAYTTNYYDALWRPVFTEKWDSSDVSGTMRIVARKYDSAGHKIYESYPQRSYSAVGDGVHHEYDALSRPTVTSADSELGLLFSGFSYQDDFTKVYTDALGHNTLYRFQVFDTPSEGAITESISLEAGVTVSIGRDQFGKATSVTRSGNGVSATHSYVYDSAERLCKTIEPETGATIQQYDAANNVQWRASGQDLPSTSSCDTGKVSAAKKTSFTYDARNRLTGTSYGDGSPSINRRYTPDGLPLSISSNGTVWSNTYNKRRLNEKESLAYGGTSYDIVRRYDVNASLAQLTYPRDNLTVAYNPNALGEPRQVGTFATDIRYHPNGAIASFRYGNGLTRTLSQNKRGNPDKVRESGVIDDSYSYDRNGNVIATTDGAVAGLATRYLSYDALNRLTKATAPNSWGDAIYTYDALDNLTSLEITSGPTARKTFHSFDPATNRLMSIRNGPPGYNFTYAYDSQGNIIRRGGQSYQFDQGNRITSVVGKATYTYDGLGHRVSTVGADGVNRVQVYSQDGQLLYSSQTSSIGTKYIYLRNHIIAEVSNSGTIYDHTDGLGSPVAQTNAGGQVISRTRYEPYGHVTAGGARTIGFTGHVNDSETALIYMQQRYYDPLAGRMLSIDPVTTDANTGNNFNRYVYANNNPYRYIDPDGRFSAQDCADMVGNCTNYGSGPVSTAQSDSKATNKIPLLGQERFWPRRSLLTSDGKTLAGTVTFTCSPPSSAQCANMASKLAQMNATSRDGHSIQITVREYGSKWTDFFSGGPAVQFYVRSLDNRGEMNQGGLAYLSPQASLTTPAHEFGHWVGFGHSTDPKSVMYPYSTPDRQGRPNDAEIKAIVDYYKK